MTGTLTNMPKTPKTKTAPTVQSPEPNVNFLLTLPFEDRMKGFQAEYKALTNKWGVYHLPVTIFDDSTIPGGLYSPKPAENFTPENAETATQV